MDSPDLMLWQVSLGTIGDLKINDRVHVVALGAPEACRLALDWANKYGDETVASIIKLRLVDCVVLLPEE